MSLSWLLHHPTCFGVWRRGSWSPQRLQPQVFSRWAPGELQTPGFGGDTLLLCLNTSCFLCLFVFLVWFPVLFISQLVLPCLFCVSCVFLQVTLLLSTGRLMSFVPRNLLYLGGRERFDTRLHAAVQGEHDQFVERVKSFLLDPKASQWPLRRNLGHRRLTPSSAGLVCYALFLFFIVNATLSLPGN